MFAVALCGRGTITIMIMNTSTIPITSAQRTAAKIVGVLYLVQMATGIFGQAFVRDSLIVAGNADKTAANILAHETLFRLSVVGDLITYIGVIVLTWALYVLLRPINGKLALLALLLRLVENAVLCMATVSSLVVLKVLSGADYLKTFGDSQLHSLAVLALAVQGQGMNVGFILLGLGSAIFAYLLFKSGYVPRWLAGLGIVGSLLLTFGTLAIIMFPAFGGGMGMAYMLPMGLYEVGLGLWLVTKGIGEPGSKRPTLNPPSQCFGAAGAQRSTSNAEGTA